jgi:hypothetical protein
MTYQPTPSQIGASTFFKEAIDASPVPMEVGVGSTYIALPIQPAEFKNLGGGGTMQNILPSVMGDKKLNWGAHTRRQSQANEALFESNASGQAAESPKPRKKGRKPKKQPKEQKVAGQQEELDDDLPKDPRRRRVLERNRIAANKCRLRKRDEALALASREEAMEDQNRYLMTCFDSLTVEIYHLKTQLLRHTECNCVLIQNYIANEAQKCVDMLVPCSNAFDTYGNSLSPCDGIPSDASTAEVLNTRSLNGGGFPSTPRISSQQGSSASEVPDVMFDMMSLEPFQAATMAPDSMAFTKSVPPSDVVQYVQPCCTYVRTERKSTYTYYVRTMGSIILLIGEFMGHIVQIRGAVQKLRWLSSSTHSAILSRLKVSPKRWRPPKLTLPSFGDSLSTSAALTPRKASDTDAVTAKKILQRPLLGGRKSISLRVRNGKPSSDKSVKLKITLAIFPHIQKLYKRR